MTTMLNRPAQPRHEQRGVHVSALVRNAQRRVLPLLAACLMAGAQPPHPTAPRPQAAPRPAPSA